MICAFYIIRIFIIIAAPISLLVYDISARVLYYTLFRRSLFIDAKDSEAVLGVWLPAPLPTPRALPDHGALWPLAVGVKKDLGGIDV